MGAPLVETFQKDPDEKLDYGVDWSERLPTGDTISASAWVVPSGITSSGATYDDTSATIWFEGGSANSDYDIINRITSAAGRIFECSFRISVRSTVVVAAAVGASLFPVTGLEANYVVFGADDSSLQAASTLTYVPGTGLTIANEEDADFLSCLTIQGGTTGAYKRYVRWLDYDDSLEAYVGLNADNAFIIFLNEDAYHPFYADPSTNIGHTYVSSQNAVYVNYDGSATGSGGLLVYDGTASGSATAANQYGRVDSTGLHAASGREVRAWNSANTAYLRMLMTTRGYLHSGEEVRIYSGADLVTIGDASTVEKFRFDTSASQFYVGANAVVGARQTGWAAPTGTADRTTFATGSVTLSELAERVKALVDDLTTHGLIGA